MKFKKRWMITLFLLFILMIGAVSAAEDSSDIVSYDQSDNQIIQSNELDEVINDQSSADNPISTDNSDANVDIGAKINEETDDEIISTVNSDMGVINSNDENVLGATPKSFTQLNTLINSDIQITLQDDYEYMSGDESVTQYGAILIRKNLFINGNGKTIDAKGNSGIFLIMADCQVTIQNLNFKNGIGISNAGGAIFAQDGPTLTIYNCNFINTAGSATGSIYARNLSSLTVSGSTFRDNRLCSAGGAIYIIDTPQFIVMNSNFSSNSASENGGAIYANGVSSLTVTSSNFTSNVASNVGGAIYANGVSSLTVSGSNFTSNVASNVGGAMYLTGCKVSSITRTTFTNNQANGVDVNDGGGAIFAVSNNIPFSLSVVNSAFKNNKADSSHGYGAAILSGSQCVNFTVQNSNFTDNTGGFGSAITALAVSKLTVFNSIFSNNKANAEKSFGGAIYANQVTDFNLNKSSFNSNNANSQGGAVEVVDVPNFVVANATFNSNGAGGGGAISSLSNSKIKVFDSTFSGNEASGAGAAVYIDGNSNLVLNNSILNNNLASLGGGAAYLMGNSNLTVFNSTLNKNTASKYGGALMAINGNVNVIKSTLNNNTANEMGGAISVGGDSKLNITDSTIGNNNAGSLGGAIYVSESANALIDNSHIDNNNAVNMGGAIYASREANVNIVKSFFESNAAKQGGAIFVDTNSYLTVNGSTFNNDAVTGTGNGGGIFVNSSTLNVINSNFTNCRAKNGGAIFGYFDANIIVSNSNFNNNIANTDNASLGGAIFLNNGSLSVISSNFTNNFANQSAGAIFVNTNTVMDITKSIFKNNTGGRDYAIAGYGDGSISNSTFIDSKVEYGFSVSSDCILLTTSSFEIAYIPDVNGSTLSLTVSEAHGFSGTVTVTIGSNNFNIYLSNGVGEQTVTLDLAPGRYKAVLNFPGTSSYTSAYAESNQFTVKGVPNFNIAHIDDFVVGTAKTISITSNPYFDGNVNLVIGGRTYSVNIVGGAGSLTVSDLSQGKYKAVIDYSGSNRFIAEHSESNEFTVKYQPEFAITNIPTTFYGEPITISINEANKLNGTVTVTIGSFDYTVDLANGIGSKTVSPDLAIGTYNVILSFTGSDKFVPGTAESNEFIVKYPSFADLNELIENAVSGSVVLEHDYVFDANYDSQFVNGISITKNIAINGNGHIIDANGLARIFDISNGAQVALENINLVNGNSLNGGAILAAAGTDLIIANCTFANNIASGDGGAIYSEGVLTASDCTFDTNPSQSGSGIHADSGEISNSEFIGGDTVSGNIDVKDCLFFTKPAFEILVSNTTIGYPITISVSETHGLNGTVTVTIGTEAYDIDLVNGVGSKVVTPNLALGTYKATLNYLGVGEFYSASTESNEFTVSINPTAISASAVTATYGVSKYLTATLKDSKGKALSGVNVIIALSNGKTYTKTTDNNGQVKLSVSGLVPKAYTATITFAGNDICDKSSKSVKVTVKKATPKMTAKAKTFKVKVKTKKYTITLKTNKGKVMKKTKLTLKVGKKTYKATTNSKGKATFKITKLTKKGKYTAVIKYAGSKYYNKLTKKVKITVKK